MGRPSRGFLPSGTSCWHRLSCHTQLHEGPSGCRDALLQEGEGSHLGFQERQGLPHHVGLRSRYGAWPYGRVGVGGGGNTTGPEGVRAVLSSLGPCWAVLSLPILSTSSWAEVTFFVFWSDGSFLKDF